jgi:hypothetical protein
MIARGQRLGPPTARSSVTAKDLPARGYRAVKQTDVTDLLDRPSGWYLMDRGRTLDARYFLARLSSRDSRFAK